MDGSFAQYALAQADYLGRIPKSLSFGDAAPILCAGVTTYKGLKETDTRAGEWVVILGAGVLGHVAIQYAKAMGMHVAAVDLGPEKMALAKKLGAEIAIDAKTQEPPTVIRKQIGGAHGVLVTAVSTVAFKQAIGMLRRGGTCVLNGLPPGEFPVPIFDVMLNRYTIRGSIVGTRIDLEEALTFAAEGRVKASYRDAAARIDQRCLQAPQERKGERPNRARNRGASIQGGIQEIHDSGVKCTPRRDA